MKINCHLCWWNYLKVKLLVSRTLYTSLPPTPPFIHSRPLPWSWIFTWVESRDHNTTVQSGFSFESVLPWNIVRGKPFSIILKATAQLKRWSCLSFDSSAQHNGKHGFQHFHFQSRWHGSVWRSNKFIISFAENYDICSFTPHSSISMSVASFRNCGKWVGTTIECFAPNSF